MPPVRLLRWFSIGDEIKSASRLLPFKFDLQRPLAHFYARRFLFLLLSVFFAEKLVSRPVSFPQSLPPPVLFRAFRTVDPRPGGLTILLHRHQTLPLSVVRAWPPYRRSLRTTIRYDAPRTKRDGPVSGLCCRSARGAKLKSAAAANKKRRGKGLGNKSAAVVSLLLGLAPSYAQRFTEREQREAEP
ncbi:hypothetical protein B0J18DRAFT_138296 [Chaetomium sp. MPI-SDFR-AT-0129]|nr:hypothetical protein B0J18DRAFT_138296 [Chaetomium sp. MPI-SDFR-AT-0129]